MKNKDGILKEYLSNENRFADLFNAIMFQGETIIIPEDLQMLDTNEVSRIKRNNKTTMKQKQRDLVRMVAHNTLFVILGVENQTEIDYTMAVRQMEYDTMRYMSQIKEITRKHKTDLDLKKGSEYLSGFCKKDKVMPIITLTLYYGSQKWDGSLDLYGMMNLPEEFKTLWNYIPNYHINLMEIAQIEDDDFQKFCSDLKLLFPLIKYQNDAVGFKKYILSNQEEYSAIQEEVYDTACVLLDGRPLNEIKKIGLNKKEGTVDMCKALEDLKKIAVEEATVEITERVKSETERKIKSETKRVTQETALNMLKEGMEIKLIAKVTKLSLEEVETLEKNLSTLTR